MENRITEKGNFWFVENLNYKVYGKLALAERVSRTDFRKSGHETREAIEYMVNDIINQYKLEEKIKSKINQKNANNAGGKYRDQFDLKNKIQYLSDEAFLKDMNCLRGNNKTILPSLGEVQYKCEDGSTSTCDYYDFMRKFGNSCSHSENKPRNPLINYENVIRCLKGYHLLLRKYYSDKISKDTPAFNENLMPIEDEYHIYNAYVPSDTSRSKCMKEFLGYIKDSQGEKAFYVVLRMYNKADLNQKFILRNADTFVEASKLSISSVPEGMTRMVEVTKYGDNNSSFYIIGYIFNKEPQMLTDNILKSIDLGKRVKMCRRIADCFYNLHTSEVPIYHRMLSYESIYVCDYGKEWAPYAIKFDFAKIDYGDVARTVIEDAVRAKSKVRELKQLKYLAPEWNIGQESSQRDWAKMDIYSLGILFSDILIGKIDTKAASLDELEELGLSDDVLDLLDVIRADSPQVRSDIQEVQLVLEEEARKWR